MSTKTADAAQAVAQQATAAGFRLEVTRYAGSSGAIVTLERSFTAGDTQTYLDAETVASYLLAAIPQTQPGTVWGTDSGSVGGAAGLSGGYFRLSKSGCSVRYAAQLAKAAGVSVTQR